MPFKRLFVALLGILIILTLVLLAIVYSSSTHNYYQMVLDFPKVYWIGKAVRYVNTNSPAGNDTSRLPVTEHNPLGGPYVIKGQGITQKKIRLRYLGYEREVISDKKGNNIGFYDELAFLSSRGNVLWFFGGGKLNSVGLTIEFVDFSKKDSTSLFIAGGIGGSLKVGNIYTVYVPTPQYFSNEGKLKFIFPHWRYYQNKSKVSEGRAKSELIAYHLTKKNENILEEFVSDIENSTIGILLPVLGIAQGI